MFGSWKTWETMEVKLKGKKKWKINKNRLKVNKLFLHVSSNFFHLFFLFYVKLKWFKNHKFLINYNYIWFSFIFFKVKPNMRKSFSLKAELFPLQFLRTKHGIKVQIGVSPCSIFYGYLYRPYNIECTCAYLQDQAEL